MSYLQVLAAAVVERKRELENLAEMTGRPASEEVTVFVRRLLAHLVRADGSIGMEELMILCGFNRDGFTWTEEIEYAREMVRDSPGFVRRTPEFIVAAREHDLRTGQGVTIAMIRSIRALCDTVVTADAYTHPHERSLVDALIATLEGREEGA